MAQGGILIGPSFLGRFKVFSESIFPERSNYVRETIAEVALMYYIFLICVRVDLQLIGGRGRQPVVIGVCCLLLPFFTVFTMGPVLVGLCSAMSFSPVPVIFPILKDLHLLNSSLGRISMSASMTNDVAGWLSLISFGAIKQYNISARRLMWFSIALVVQLAVTVFMIRPAMHWIILQTPEGKPVKHRFVVPILLGVLVMGFFSDLMGASNLEGPMILGVVVPDGSVLSLTLLERTETILSCFLFPLFFCSFGLKTNLFTNSSTTLSGIVAFVSIVLGCQVAKMVGTIAPSMYYDLPFSDALVLSMILSFKGLVEVFTYVKLLNSKVLDEKAYRVLVLSIILTTGIISPMVVHLIDQQHTASDELRILTCIHNQDQVSGIINILDASNSTPHCTISLYLFHLVELLGHPFPILITHHHSQHLSSPRSHHANSPIISAFKNYELRNEPGAVTLNAFTDISPFATMHEDICSVALDHSISLILLPFPRQWSIDCSLNCWLQYNDTLQIINPNAVAEAPCSVGLFVDRSTTTCTTAGISSQLHRIAAIFIGGPHEREVLSYAACMAGNSRVRLTVVRFVPYENHRRGISRERQLD
ncbi:cation/H+ antiporter 15-like protein [Cinnamomum micranthum f. kanehirae]|uniref:Cation/H+ antiporter 15-like protein n=1 Tax=Cinnamomum micranthum f. kanehirae TaxID=337451 RepID=A0A3S4NT42_9MAGN|nr:cation/H+ antiporter 15-like protein [Cinnamomum micranthum f. kanehirae]